MDKQGHRLHCIVNLGRRGGGLTRKAQLLLRVRKARAKGGGNKCKQRHDSSHGYS